MSPRSLACILAGAACLLFASRAHAFDPREPARARFRVLDEAGRPVAGARVTLHHTAYHDTAEAREGLRALTDREGAAAFELRHPDPHAPSPAFAIWSLTVRVEAGGHAPYRGWIVPFPGAVFEREIPLRRATTTTVRLRSPDGRPLAGVELTLSYADSDGYMRGECVRTNERGEYVFLRSAGPQGAPGSGFTVTVGGRRERFGEAREVEMTLHEDDLPASALDRRLVLTLVGPEGAPAAGWFVARKPKGGVGDGSIGGESTSRFAAASLERVGADGVIALQRPGEHLAVVSPEGVLFMYPLAPRTWRGRERRVTLRLPPVRRRHRAWVAREDGGPLAGLPVAPASVRFLHRRSSLGIGPPGFEGPPSVPLRKATATDGTPVGSLFTDGNGRFEVPVHVGARTLWHVAAGGMMYGANPASDVTTVRVRAPRERAPAAHKRIAFDFRDERGKRIPDMLLTSGGHLDSRGCNVFVDAGVDRLEIKTRAREWAPLRKTLDVSGPGDRVVPVTVPDRLRLPRLAGRVLDPDGRPVEGVSARLWRSDPRYGKRLIAIGMTAETDGDGRFAFEAAPEECLVKLHRFGADGLTKPLPGWIGGPVAVTPDAREITIRLERAGSVRLVLGEATDFQVGNLYLRPAEKTPGDEWAFCGFFKRAAENVAEKAPGENELVARGMRPGRYSLFASCPAGDYDTLGVAGIAVDVAAGEEAVIDLGKGGRYPPRRRPHAWVDVSLVHEGRPVSGAVVMLYALPAPENRIRRPFPRGSDLSDDAGQARFHVIIGRRHVVFARVHGRLVGWKPFEAAGGDALRVEMVRAKTLVVRLAGAHSPPKVCVRLPGAGEDEAAALFTGLELYEPMRFSTARATKRDAAREVTGLLRADGPAGFVAEDLPAGRTFVVEVRDRHPDELLAQRAAALAADGAPVREIEIDIGK